MISYEKHEGYGRIAMASPPVNAIGKQFVLDFHAALDKAEADGPMSALVIESRQRTFCAGADLALVNSYFETPDGPLEMLDYVRSLHTLFDRIEALPMVTIAAVDGPALGAGTQLAIACDLRVASPTSPFGIPAAKLGLAVDRWTIDRLSAEFGASVARSMLLAAQTATAEQLHVTGAVHRLGGLADALVWADELAHLAPLTIRAHKLGLEADERFEAARVAAWASADAEEGRLAFLEKRPPVFRAE